MRPRRPLLERWMEKVEKTDSCWLWLGARKGWGYGHLSRGGRGEGFIAAHRFAYEHFVGPIPEGQQVQHTCHNVRCVNPAHLQVGTPRENTRAMIEAGRDNFRDNLP